MANRSIALRSRAILEALERRTLLSGNALTGTVYNDANLNRRRDAGELGVPGVTVDLVEIDTHSLQTATSDSEGIYTFDDLAPGVYQVDGVGSGHKLTEPFYFLEFFVQAGGPQMTITGDLPTVGYSVPSPYVDQSFGDDGIALGATRDVPIAIFHQHDGKLLVPGVSEIYRFNADGTVDTNFGTNGAQAHPAQYPFGVKAITQADGKILEMGYFTSQSAGGTIYTGAIARYNLDGTADTSFGANGVVQLGLSGYPDGSLSYDGNGRIVYVFDQTNAGVATFTLGRLTPDGMPDLNFGPANGGGRITGNGTPVAVAVQQDNKILVDPSSLTRYTESGALDPTFGNGGVTSAAANIKGVIVGIAALPGGKIIVAGFATSSTDPGVSRINADGSLDTTFGNSGTGDIPITAGASTHHYPSYRAFTMDSAGDLILSGVVAATSPFESDFLVARFLPNGQPDTGFGTGGSVLLPIVGDDELASATALPDESIVAVGTGGDQALLYHIELARLLPGRNRASISGTVYSDTNSSGLHDPAEPGVGAGWTVYADLNNNKSMDANEPKSTTAADGSYTLSGLSAGPYTLRVVAPAGWTPTFPAAGNGQQLTLTDFESAGGVDFGLIKPVVVSGSISGTIFNDTNGNGLRDAGELSSAGRIVYIDKNKNGTRDSGEVTITTAADGTFTFSGLSAGSYRIRETLPTGWVRTSPTAGYLDVTLAAGQIAAGTNFGESQSVTISGSVYNDANANAKKESTEKGIASRTVFIDKNKNGKLDTGEAKVVTATDGSYVFKNLLAGSYRIAEVLTAGWRRTAPAVGYFDVTLAGGKTSNSSTFAETTKGLVTGVVFKDANANGKQDAGEAGLAGWVLYLDTNNNGKLDAGEQSLVTDSSGKYSFTLSAGKYNLREVLKTGFKRTTPTAGVYAITLTSGLSVSGKIFGN